uniref:Non-haem dioxygenase N-terminal domain-containing protein n=1 Tax=Chaetoceros debilis TaxID=122233 RepID=A0A7S3VGP3_9STRA
MVQNSIGLRSQQGNQLHPPVISLTSNSVIQEIDEACSTWGAFVLTDHGIGPETLYRILDLGQEFFDLPLDTQIKYNLQEYGAKWQGFFVPIGGERSVNRKIAKKVAKMFPELVPERFWRNLHSTSQPLPRDALVVQCLDMSAISKAEVKVKNFYVEHTEIKASHGWTHIDAVYKHTKKALLSLEYKVSSKVAMEIKLTALCHDMDDKKYFPDTRPGDYPNASAILEAVGITHDDDSGSHERILKMISWVGCSENGNSVPEEIEDAETYHLLIPRWADRLEAVGARGVVRCYQYNQEKGRPLSTEASPRPQNEEELWDKYAIPSKLQDYMDRGGTSTDMISHYYDKLLHISRPPAVIVRNPYLEGQAGSSSTDLVEVCLRYGKTGEVDEDFIMNMMIK